MVGIGLIFSPTRSTDIPSQCGYASQVKNDAETSNSVGFYNRYNFQHYAFLIIAFLCQCSRYHNAPMIIKNMF